MEKKKREIRDADAVIREYYERDTGGSFREDGTEPVSSVETRSRRDAALSPKLSGGDPDTASDPAGIGAETADGSNPTPDQDLVEEMGRAAGITYNDDEPLKFGDKVPRRDDRRWELNPASAEDYAERTRESTGTPPKPEANPQGPHQAKSKSGRKARPRHSSR